MKTKKVKEPSPCYCPKPTKRGDRCSYCGGSLKQENTEKEKLKKGGKKK